MTEIPLSQTTPDAKIVDTLHWIQSEKKEAVNAVLWDIKKALEGLKGEVDNKPTPQVSSTPSGDIVESPLTPGYSANEIQTVINPTNPSIVPPTWSIPSGNVPWFSEYSANEIQTVHPTRPPVRPPVKPPQRPSVGSTPGEGSVTNNSGWIGIIDSTLPANNLVNPTNPALEPPTSTIPSGNVPWF